MRRRKFSHVDMYLAKAHVAAEPTGGFFEVGHFSCDFCAEVGPFWADLGPVDFGHHQPDGGPKHALPR